MRFTFDLDDAETRAYFSALAGRAANTAPLMRDLALYGEHLTRQSFAAERTPGGQPWQPSRRKQERGGKTLTDSGHLGDSVNSAYTANTAEFGLGMKYAAIHQFGGTITAKGGGLLKFATPGGGFAAVRSVTIPQRRMLPESLEEMDPATLAEIVIAHLGNKPA